MNRIPPFDKLHLLATITDGDSKNWSISFSTHDGGKLWLIPISRSAENEAGLAYESASKIPNIVCTALELHGNIDRDGHYDIATEASLLLEKGTRLDQLQNGYWDYYAIEEKRWYYWCSNAAIEPNDPTIVFRAPKCHLISTEGDYNNYNLWFGKRNLQPFIGLDQQGLFNGADCPLIWSIGFGVKRHEDLICHKNNEILYAFNFYDGPFKHFDNHNGQRSERFLEIFNGKHPTGVLPWMYMEEQGTAETKKRIISVCYARQIRFERINGVYSILFQKCATDKIQLLTILYHLRELFKESYNLIRDTRNGMHSILGANPMGIVPELPTYSFPENVSYSSEWETEYSENCSALNNFSLKRSIIFNSFGAPVRVPKFDFTVNISPTNAASALKLSDAQIETKIKEEQVNDNGTILRLMLSDYTVENKTIIDGAFEFELGTKERQDGTAPEKKYGQVQFTLQNSRTQQPFFLWQYHKNDKDIQLQYSIKEFSLPVLRVKAAGQDLLRNERFMAPANLGTVTQAMGERNEPPLIIPLDHRDNDKSEQNNYFLTLSESVNVGQDYRLDIKLEQVKTDTDTDNNSSLRAVILDTNPQFLGLIDARFLQQPGYDDGVWTLARRSQISSEQGAWEILDDQANTEGFTLVLPAQAIGEAYVKNDKKADGSVESGEPEEGKPADFRFGAPALLKLSNERLEKRYVAPPWNLRHIWGQPGSEAPGVPFLEAQFELLYGLMGHLKPEKAGIAELASKLGEIPLPPANSIFWEPTTVQQKAFAQAWLNYVQFYRAWKSRLAILEPSAAETFGNTDFIRNLTYIPRIDFENGDLTKRKGAYLRYPIKAISPQNQTNTQEPESIEPKMYASHDKDGLAGGFHYGFESEAIYKEFWREAFREGSSSAELQAPAFSSLGGWGRQTARFAGDKTIIKSTTAMGRTQFYAVERIGRIGVLWHKAKHVIEYERTVVPSEYGQQQPGHRGRPLIRKVREYIEILEPEKNYPDFQGQPDEAPGAVKACHFKSIIIPVRNSWGRDVSFKTDDKVENIGWEIPLWHPEADPKLFPKPQIAFLLVPPADSNLESVPVNLSEPQNIWFYTDTRPEVDLGKGETIKLTADISRWPAIKYIDYTDLSLPEEKHLNPALDPDSGKGMELTLPDVLEVPPGFERFTFRVDAARLPAGVANRYNAQSGISGKLRAVTMMRKPLVVQDYGETHPNNNAVFKTLASEKDSIINLMYNADLDNESKIDAVKDKIKSLAAAISELDEDHHNISHLTSLYGRGSEFLPPIQHLWKEAVVASEGLLSRAIAGYDGVSTIFRDEINELVQRGGDYKNEVIEALRRFGDRTTLPVNAMEFGLEFFTSLRLQFQLVNNYYKDEILGKLIKALNSTVTKIDEILAGSLTELTQIKTSIITQLTSCSSLCSQVKIKLTANVSPDQNLDTIRKEIIKVIEAFEGTLPSTKNRIEGAVDIGGITRIINEFKGNLHSFSDKIKDLFETISAFENRYFDEMAIALNRINQLARDIENEIKTTLNREIKDIEEEWEANTGDILRKTEAKILKISTLFKEQLKTLFERVLYKEPHGQDSIFGILLIGNNWLNLAAGVLLKKLIDVFSTIDQADNLEEWLGRFNEYKELQNAIRNGNRQEILKRSVALANSLNPEFGRLAGEVAERMKLLDQAGSSFESVRNTGKQTLENYRSVWNEFTAPGMGLNRRTIAMIVNKDWQDVQQRLSITPSVARLKQFENDLEGLGLRLPVTNIFEGLLPPKKEWAIIDNSYTRSLLDRFNFSDVLSDIGGMRLDKMFPGLKMPSNLRDHIRLTQGFDRQNLTAWCNAEIDFKFDRVQSLLSIGPINIKLNQARFVASTRMEIDIEGEMRKRSSGMLIGNWETYIGGVGIMIFKEARVIFKDNKLTFDLDPKRMEMPGLLKLLTDASQKISGLNNAAGGEKEEPFKIELLETEFAGKNIPIGVQASLNIPPISVGGGPTSMTNLSFGGHFMLKFWDRESRKFNFTTGVGFYIGKQEAPFNFTAFILGGGGFVNSSLTFRPEEGLTADFTMSVHASVGIYVALGWMNGGVLIMLGFEGHYHKSGGVGSSVYIGVFVQVLGTVSIAGLVTIYLGLRLAATYANSKLIGTGRVSVKIKICWCVTVRVNKQYTKTFIGGSGSRKMINFTEGIPDTIIISNTLS